MQWSIASIVLLTVYIGMERKVTITRPLNPSLFWFKSCFFFLLFCGSICRSWSLPLPCCSWWASTFDCNLNPEQKKGNSYCYLLWNRCHELLTHESKRVSTCHFPARVCMQLHSNFISRSIAIEYQFFGSFSMWLVQLIGLERGTCFIQIKVLILTMSLWDHRWSLILKQTVAYVQRR